MRRLTIGLAVGVALGVALTLIVGLLTPSRSWEEESVRSQADVLACGLSHGLGASCAPVATLRRDDRGTWVVAYGKTRRLICYELWPSGRPPQRRSCPSELE
jgi:hypothetical protein